MLKCRKAVVAIGAIASILGAMNAEASDGIVDVAHYRALVGDRRAYRVGDPLVVVVVESTTAQSSAVTGASNTVAFGAQAHDSIAEASVGIDLTGKNDGAGQTTRTGRAFTQLSTRIVEVLPNNAYRIEGEQSLMVNGERQRVVLAGIVRSEDIEEDNTVESFRIADARIEIAGVGVVNDAQRQSIVYRVMKWLRIL